MTMSRGRRRVSRGWCYNLLLLLFPLALVSPLSATEAGEDGCVEDEEATAQSSCDGDSVGISVTGSLLQAD